MMIIVQPPLPGLQEEDECSPSPVGTGTARIRISVWCRSCRMGMSVHPSLPGLQDEDEWGEWGESLGRLGGGCRESVVRVLGDVRLTQSNCRPDGKNQCS